VLTYPFFVLPCASHVLLLEGHYESIKIMTN